MPIASLTPQEKHHPAKFSTGVLGAIGDLMIDWLDAFPDPTDEEQKPRRVYDPYSGVGWIHRRASLYLTTFAGELEQPWASNHGHANRTVQADAAHAPFRDDTFHGIATSAVYMNRMRDHHNARDTSERKTYLHQYQKLVGDFREQLHEQNMGAMNNTQYRAAAQSHIREFKRITMGGGLLFLNMSNSIDKGNETNSVEQWLNWLTLAGCFIREVRPVETRRMLFGENRLARVEHEVVIVAMFPEKASQGSML